MSNEIQDALDQNNTTAGKLSAVLGVADRLQARITELEKMERAGRDLVLELNEHHTYHELHRDVIEAIKAVNKVLDAPLLKG